MKHEIRPWANAQPIMQVLVGVMLLAVGLLQIYHDLNNIVGLAAVIVGAALLTVGGVVIGVRKALRQVLREELNPAPKERILNLD
jgi:hypothetical protein